MESTSPVSRRRALTVGAGIAGGLVAADALRWRSSAGAAPMPMGVGSAALPPGIIQEIERIVQAQGMVSNGVLNIEVDRSDIPLINIRGVPIKSPFEINGNLYFQSLGGGRVTMNSDLCLKTREIDAFIDQLLLHDITFQAEHQHFYDFDPIVWFIHFRATGDPVRIAQGAKAALNVTSTPFPQMSPTNPTTPLPANQLGQILGAQPSIGADGVVNFDIPRAEPITLGGIRVNPYLNMATSVSFEPYGGGENAVGIPDFGMIASEIQNVVGLMRSRGWDIGCLYNQETDEFPQLFFSHQFKTGNALQLAREIRAALNRMNVKFV